MCLSRHQDQNTVPNRTGSRMPAVLLRAHVRSGATLRARKQASDTRDHESVARARYVLYEAMISSPGSDAGVCFHHSISLYEGQKRKGCGGPAALWKSQRSYVSFEHARGMYTSSNPKLAGRSRSQLLSSTPLGRSRSTLSGVRFTAYRSSVLRTVCQSPHTIQLRNDYSPIRANGSIEGICFLHAQACHHTFLVSVGLTLFPEFKAYLTC